MNRTVWIEFNDKADPITLTHVVEFVLTPHAVSITFQKTDFTSGIYHFPWNRVRQVRESFN